MRTTLIIVIVCFTVISCTDLTPAEKARQKAQDSIATAKAMDAIPLEQRLAMLDKGTEVAADAIEVTRIRVLLGFLSKSFNESRDTIAEYTSRVQGVLEKEYGIKETNLHILEELNAASYAAKGSKYREAVTLYAMIRSRQSSESK